MESESKSLAKNPFRMVFNFHRQELPVALSLSLFFFLFISVFWILRPLKKGLFVDALGADIELYAKLLNILISTIAVLVFTVLVNKLQRQKVIYALCLFFALSFALLGYSLREPKSWNIWSFYLLGDLLTTVMVTAFWAYVTDISNTDQAKRLYGVVGAGAVLGGWVGVTIAKLLLKQFGMTGLLFLSGAIMIVLIVLIFFLESMVSHSMVFAKDTRPLEQRKVEEPKAGLALEGARLALQSKYLAAIVGIMASYEIGSQVNDYQFSRFSESLEGITNTQAFMTNVGFYANLLATVVQLFLVSLIIKRLGLTVALLTLPLALLVSSTAFFIVPSLMMASLLFISDNGLNYSIEQTARESLYVVTSPDEKYKARAFTNMFVQRLAKGLAIFTVLGLGLLGLVGESVRYLSFVTIALMIVMVLLSVYAGREFARKNIAMRLTTDS